MIDELEQLAARECEREMPDLDERKRFDAMLGHHKSCFDALHWQIIAPLKDPPHGTRKLNAVIQDHFHGWASVRTVHPAARSLGGPSGSAASRSARWTR